MSKIKLVIKIDEENYKRIKDDVYDTHDIHRAIMSIRKGTLLDDIKEIPSAEPKTVPIAVIRFDDDKLHEIVEEAVKNIEIEPKWIPISERLPEKNMRCLVAVGKFYLTQMAIYSNLMGTIDHRIFYQGDYGYGNFENITQYVKAWMPLPKPYEPTCDTCEYTTAAFNPCNACKDKSEYKPQESEE